MFRNKYIMMNDKYKSVYLEFLKVSEDTINL